MGTMVQRPKFEFTDYFFERVAKPATHGLFSLFAELVTFSLERSSHAPRRYMSSHLPGYSLDLNAIKSP